MPDGLAIKFFMPWDAGQEVIGDGNERLTIATSVRTLGVWINTGGWPPDGPPLRHLALEPCIGDHDSARDAAASGTVGLVDPGATASWSMTMRLDRDH